MVGVTTGAFVVTGVLSSGLEIFSIFLSVILSSFIDGGVCRFGDVFGEFGLENVVALLFFGIKYSSVAFPDELNDLFNLGTAVGTSSVSEEVE